VDQPLTDHSANPAAGAPLQQEGAIFFLPGQLAGAEEERPFVAVVRDREEGIRWLGRQSPGLQWLQLESLIQDAGFWTQIAQCRSRFPIDVVLSNPASDFAALYRLVDVRSERPVRVTLPALTGFSKAVRLAVSLGLPVRILPGQPSSEVLVELEQMLAFYLHDPLVESPVEFFHSVLASFSGADLGSVWTILEEDPARFRHFGPDGNWVLPRQVEPVESALVPEEFVANRFNHLIASGSECAACPWQEICQGYFKWPDANYSCAGIKLLFSKLEQTTAEMQRALGSLTPPETGPQV
jgi:hypothetical protein